MKRLLFAFSIWRRRIKYPGRYRPAPGAGTLLLHLIAAESSLWRFSIDSFTGTLAPDDTFLSNRNAAAAK